VVVAHWQKSKVSQSSSRLIYGNCLMDLADWLNNFGIFAATTLGTHPGATHSQHTHTQHTHTHTTHTHTPKHTHSLTHPSIHLDLLSLCECFAMFVCLGVFIKHQVISWQCANVAQNVPQAQECQTQMDVRECDIAVPLQWALELKVRLYIYTLAGLCSAIETTNQFLSILY